MIFRHQLAAWHAGLPQRGPLRHLCAFGGGGGKTEQGNTTSVSTQTQYGASDQAVLAYGSNVREGTVEIGAGSTVINADADVAKAAITGSTTVTGQMSDFASGVVDHALSSNAALAQNILKNNESFMAEIQAGVGQIAAGSLATLSDLAKNTTTGGISDANKNMMYLGIAALVVILFALRK